MSEITVQTVDGPVKFKGRGTGGTGDGFAPDHGIDDAVFASAAGTVPAGTKQTVLVGGTRQDNGQLVTLRFTADSLLKVSAQGSADGEPIDVSWELAKPVEVTAIPPVSATLLAGTNSVGSVKDDGPAAGMLRQRFQGDGSGPSNWITVLPGAAQRIQILDIIAKVGADMTLSFYEETSGTLLFDLDLLAAASMQQFSMRGCLETVTAQRRVRVAASSSTAIKVWCIYRLIPNA